MSVRRGVQIVDKDGIVLVFPLPDRDDPPSLWSRLYPGSAMDWRWDADADPRVASTWHLRERLARSREVVYAKWFRGRATFFAKPIFRTILGRLDADGRIADGLSPAAREVLASLEDNSPQSTKELRRSSGLEGKENERSYQKAVGELWSRLLVVGVGEVPDGAFPSLAMAATSLFFEDLWLDRGRVVPDDERRLDAVLASSKAIRRAFDRSLATVRGRDRA
ncbi:MAG: hypothetical protein U0169_05150 [Polyangiaceae bacterium]